jgi:flavin-dependent dehydrogenase
VVLSSVGWPVVPGIEELSWKGTPALTRRPAAVAGHRLFAVGDAAGYVEPFTGEGMAWAIASATAVAPMAMRAITAWHSDLVAEWQRTHARLLGHRQRVCRVVAHVLRWPTWTRLAVTALRVVPSLSQPLVFALNRSRT